MKKGFNSSKLSRILYSNPLPKIQGERLNSFTILIALDEEFSLDEIKTNGLSNALDRPRLSKDEFEDMGSFSDGYSCTIS